MPAKPCLNVRSPKFSYIVVDDPLITPNTDVTPTISDDHNVTFDSVMFDLSGTRIKIRLTGQRRTLKRVAPRDGILAITLTDPVNVIPDTPLAVAYVDDDTRARRRAPKKAGKKPGKKPAKKPRRKA